MNATEVQMRCRHCGAKVGLATVVSIGSPHQWIDSVTCMGCLPGVVERAKEAPQSRQVPQSRIEKVEAFLHDNDAD